MMRRFFKKLTFVMALSMVVSSASPAARIVSAADDRTLSIAYQNGATITELNLTEVRSSEDLKAVGAPSNWKELGVNWISMNDKVATVDKAGVVTAVSSGTTEIMVTCGDYIGTITVNCLDAAKQYTVTLGTAEERSITDKTLKVGETIDLNFYGVKDYSRDAIISNVARYACTWNTTNPKVATVDNKTGIVTAVAPGEATITLIVTNLATNTPHSVIPCDITVEADATPTPTPTLIRNQLNATQNTIYVDADEDAGLNINNVEFYHVFKADNDKNGDGIIDEKYAENPYENFYVKSVSYNEEKAAWEITTYYDFTDGEKYEVRANKREEQFTASVGAVNRVEVKVLQNAKLETDNSESIPAKVSVKLYDAKDVDVTDREIDGIANNDVSNITFSFVEENTAYSFVDYDEIEFYEDATALVQATYTYGNKEITSTPVSIKPSEYATYGIEGEIIWTLVEPGKKADWSNLVHTMPAGESGWTIATLFKDTYGDYYTTHQASAGSEKYVLNGKKYDVYYTEDPEKPFWKGGFYVEYKAMNPDKMLIEDYGEVASYEKGTARYAMYLYNYNRYNNEFVTQVYSQSITVCHPTEMTKMEVLSNNISIMADTKDEGGIVDAYYSLFSEKDVVVALKDSLHNTLAGEDHASAAAFEIELLTKSKGEKDTHYDTLKELVEEVFAERLNKTRGYDVNEDGNIKGAEAYAYYALNVGANDFLTADGESILYGRNQIKFKITETTTKTSATVTLNVLTLTETKVNYKDIDGTNQTTTSEVALVKELSDTLGTTIYFEKFVLSESNITIKQNSYNTSYSKGYDVALAQVDQKNNKIGYDSNLYITTNTNTNSTRLSDIYGVDNDGNVLQSVASSNLKKGDRVMFVKDPSGKVYSLYGDSDGVANSVYTKSEESLLKKYDRTDLLADSTSSNLGITVNKKYLQAVSATAAAATTATSNVDISAYQFLFSAKGTNNELVYAKNGRYSATILTVESIDRMPYEMEKATEKNGALIKGTDGKYTFTDGVAVYTKDADGVNYTIFTGDYNENVTYYVVKVDDNNVPKDNKKEGNIIYATGAGLKATVNFTVENNNPEVTFTTRTQLRIDDYLPYNEAGRGVDDDSIICKAIVEAFNFKLGDSTWTKGDDAGELDASNILYYTYTVAASNGQIIINDVVFKVPVMSDDVETGDWYRSTATVDQSLTFNK